MEQKRTSATTSRNENYYVNDYYYNNDDTNNASNNNYYEKDVQELLKEIHFENNMNVTEEEEQHQIKQKKEEEALVVPEVNTDNEDSSVEMNTNPKYDHNTKISVVSTTIRAASNLLLRDKVKVTTTPQDDDDYIGTTIANLGCVVPSCFTASAESTNNNILLLSSSSTEEEVGYNTNNSDHQTDELSWREAEGDYNDEDIDDDDSDVVKEENIINRRSRRRRRRVKQHLSNTSTTTTIPYSSNNDNSLLCYDGCDDILLKEGERHRIPTIAAPTYFYNLNENTTTTSTNNKEEEESNTKSVQQHPQQKILRGYFDAKLLSNIKDVSIMNKTIQDMALDNRIFLRTVLTLISEYFPQGTTTASTTTARSEYRNHPLGGSIMKTGPLKKYSHLSRRWKVKFVEVRPGMLSYYEDELPAFQPVTWIDNIIDHHHNHSSTNSSSQQQHPPSSNKRLLNRKDIPLNKQWTSCRILDADHVPPAVNIGSSDALNTDYVFEILCQEDSASSTCVMKKIWMAHTKEERNSWIEVIQRAMDYNNTHPSQHHHSSTTPLPKNNNTSPFIPMISSSHHWDAYTNAKIQCEKISSLNYLLPQETYQLCQALFHTLYHHKSFYINFDWWLLHTHKTKKKDNNHKNLDNPQQIEVEEYHVPIHNNNSNEDDAKDVSLIWKLLCRKSTTIIFNGTTFYGNAPFVPEQVMGSIIRCFMEIIVLLKPCLKTNNAHVRRSTNIFQSGSDDYRMDMQATIFARDIVLAACRYLLMSSSSSSSVHQSAVYDAVSLLFTPPFTITPLHNSDNKRKNIIDISITTPVTYNNNTSSSSKTNTHNTTSSSLHHSTPQKEHHPTSPKSINEMKKHANNNTAITYPNTKSGWVMARMKNNKRYKKRYCILSDNVLSFYENDAPRPHGLKSQLVLSKNSFLQISSVQHPNNSQIIERHILTIFKNKEKSHRQFQWFFLDCDDYLSWKLAFHSSILAQQQQAKQAHNRQKSVDSISLPSLESNTVAIDYKNNSPNFQENAHTSAETIRTTHVRKSSGSSSTSKLKTNVSNKIREKLQQHRSVAGGISLQALPPSSSTQKSSIVVAAAKPSTTANTTNTTSAAAATIRNHSIIYDSPNKSVTTKKKQLQALLKKGISFQDTDPTTTTNDLPTTSPPPPGAQQKQQEPIAQIAITSIQQKYKITLENIIPQEQQHYYTSPRKLESNMEDVTQNIMVQTSIVQYYFLYMDNNDDDQESRRIENSNGCYMLKGEEIIHLEFY